MREGKPPKHVRFYDEREWRYIPNTRDTALPLLSKSEYSNSVTRANANRKIEKAKLGFEPDDIRYLIIKEENEISAMVRALKEIKAKYNQETIEKLISRIMTCEQIRNDV